MKNYPLLCTVTQEPGHGGIAQVGRLLWQALQEISGEQCRLITLIPERAKRPSAMDKLRFAKNVVGDQVRGKVDWIMFNHLGLARVQRLVPRQHLRPYVVFLHSVEVWNSLSAERKQVLKKAAVRIANSNYTARRVLGAHPDIGPIHVCHLALLPNGAANWMGCGLEPADGKVDTELLKQVQQNSVLIVGRMEIHERHKGHRQLIEAWPFVKARVPGAQLVIVGRGDDLEGIKARARESGLGSGMLFTGHVNDATLEAIYQRAALFAMPSRGEGFGLVYLEAMQHGLACIGSIHDAATEVIEPGVTGLLVDQDDLTGLADAISGLLLNPSRREEMGRAGLKRVQKVFSFEQFHDRILSALKPLVKDGSVCAQETNG